ncbi:hypothetical protein J6590_061038 [Homalodisca vitripennis]|nr:hypothetical protein J6590_061038 [Homalodisca vitripennis]
MNLIPQISQPTAYTQIYDRKSERRYKDNIYCNIDEHTTVRTGLTRKTIAHGLLSVTWWACEGRRHTGWIGSESRERPLPPTLSLPDPRPRPRAPNRVETLGRPTRPWRGTRVKALGSLCWDVPRDGGCDGARTLEVGNQLLVR